MKKAPFFYLMAALVAGILFDDWARPAFPVAAGVAFAATALSTAFVMKRMARAATVSLLAAFCAAGALLAFAERTGVERPRLKLLFEERAITESDPIRLTGVLAAAPEPAPRAYYLDLSAESLELRSETRLAAGRARLFVPLADAEAAVEFERLGLKYGSRLRVTVRLERARGYKNPGSPDFNDFLESRGYDLKGTIKSPLLIEHFGAAEASGIMGALYRVRVRVMSEIDARFRQPVAGTLKAMLVDNRYFLDADSAERLREGATFHILSISGMHVGIIAWALLGGWSPPKRFRAGRVLVSVAALWGYAVMVGLAPPVTRATLMISVGLIGPLLFRRAASINTVSLAAFVMLAVRPSLLTDPAFQLSFVAVASIVTIALPLGSRLRRVGEWRVTAETPHPPACSGAVRVFAEALFWDERKFRQEMRGSVIKYRLDKAGVARVLNGLRVQPLARAAALLVLTSLAIQIATLPLAAFYLNRVSPVGVLLNVFAGLLTAVLMLTALGGIVAGALSATAATPFAWLAEAAHHLLVNSVTPFTFVPAATFRVAHYEGWPSAIYIFYFIPLALLVALIDRWQPVSSSSRPRSDLHFRSVCGASLAVCIALIIVPVKGNSGGKLTIHFLDVGQGDSALIIFPAGTTMLVDGGGEIRFNQGREDGEAVEANFRDSAFAVGEAVVSRFLWSLGITSVDYVVATHMHADHAGGLTDVIRNFRVGQLVLGRVPLSDPEFNRLRETAARLGIPLGMVSAGESFNIEGVTVEVLWPPRESPGEMTSGNDDSLVLRLAYGSMRALLTGDIERGSEAALVRSGMDLRAEVLKVPHHGSKTSSSDEFLDAVRPHWAVFSVGERSRFGHPHPAVVNNYLARGVALLQTGRDGTVTVETDGTTVNVRTVAGGR